MLERISDFSSVNKCVKVTCLHVLYSIELINCIRYFSRLPICRRNTVRMYDGIVPPIPFCLRFVAGTEFLEVTAFQIGSIKV